MIHLGFQKFDFQHYSLLLPLQFQRLPWYTGKLYKPIIILIEVRS